MKNQAFQAHAAARLDRHDSALELDTRQVATPMIGHVPPPSPGGQIEQQGEWYYSQGSGKVGPYSLNDLIQFIANGTIRRETLVWDPYASDWIAAGTSETLKSNFV